MSALNPLSSRRANLEMGAEREERGKVWVDVIYCEYGERRRNRRDMALYVHRPDDSAFGRFCKNPLGKGREPKDSHCVKNTTLIGSRPEKFKGHQLWKSRERERESERERALSRPLPFLVYKSIPSLV